ncbi:hypothetical protein K504DRAFT_466148 [Pleomassaria siparia CBS 279.74]|uniref:Uncharacterized protein n=1 Tax=Pleomassaria siparia CBS 279.74 TaxID=1314801 RepID=A0A6G1KE71_9PLEO|nr:hypothetical protein K504DRAFT_466148 [Pleomassaria siparia CBS 279.74]
MLDSTSASTIVLLSAASALILAAMLYPSSFLRWLQRKRYQYEVTFSLYMLTSTEKIIFNSVLFLILSLFIIAASLYLPEHIFIVTKRMFYYFSGDEENLATANNAAHQVLSSATQFVKDAGQSQIPGGALAGPGRGLVDV